MASTVKHLRSSTASKRPTASGLAEGQLAINTASGTPGLFLKDSAGTVVKVGPVHVGTSAPNATPAGSAGNSTGELWVDNSSTINGLNYYTGSAFVNLTPSGTATVAGLVELATDAETQTGTDTIRAVTPSGLQSKVSNSTSTTSSTTIASSTAVKAAYDLADAALPKAGGRVTGNLEIGPVGSLSFEGSSDDSFETTLAVVNPTADRTITLPNVTGTVITTGDSGTVTSTMIADGTIVDADINASAAIALSKLATGALPTGITVSSGNIVDGTIVNADINASAAITLSKLATGALPTAITIASANIVDGTIVNADVGTSANIASTKLSFTQSGIDAVARTVDSRLKDAVSVKDFGAVGDGAADDTTAIQAAINAAEAAGRGTIRFPAGLYRVTATLTVDSNNVYICGAGMWNTIITRSTNYGDTLVFTGNSATGVRCLNCGVTDIGFDNSGLITSGAHLRMTGVSNFEVNSVYAANGFYNFLFEGALAGKVANTYLLGTNVYGGSGTDRAYVLFRNSTGAYSHPSCGDIFVDNFNWRANTANQLYSYGLRIESADGLWFDSGHIGNSSLANISIDSATAEILNLVFFSSVMSDEGVDYSCLIEGSSSSVFETIHFSSCAFKSGGSPAFCKFGIVVASGATATELMLSNCIIEEFARTGVEIQSDLSGAITFNGCMVKGNGRTIASPGYNITANARDISIVGGYSGRTWSGLGVGNQTFGVSVGGGATNISINGVDLAGNATGPLSVDGTALAEINNCILGPAPTVASASTLAPPAGFRYFYVSGTTTINNIQVSQRDRVITIIFTDSVTVSDAVGNIRLNGNFAANNHDALTVLYDGTAWIELSRSPN